MSDRSSVEVCSVFCVVVVVEDQFVFFLETERYWPEEIQDPGAGGEGGRYLVLEQIPGGGL